MGLVWPGRTGGAGGCRHGDVINTVIFQDTFAGPPGSAPDPAKWRHQSGGDGWGNQELQTYTSSLANCHLDGQGHLVITATRTGRGPADLAAYSSARLNSVFQAQYGHIEARISMPSGRGLWPAFWMMGHGAPWPICGELDIMEAINDCSAVYQTAHGTDGTHGRPWHQQLAVTTVGSGFHIYAADWSAGEVSVYVDGQLTGRLTRRDLHGTAVWPFGERPMYLLLNLAVGGQWPGDPSPGTPFPASMLVDYVEWSR